MTRRPEVTRARSFGANVVAVAVLVAVVVAVPMVAANWSGFATSLQDEVAAFPARQAAADREQAAGSESLLVLVEASDGRIGSLALAAIADDRPATVTIVPSSLYELLPGYGEFPLSEAVRFEGTELAAIAVANALGVRIDRTARVTASSVEEAGFEVAVDLPEAVVATEGGNSFEVAAAGRAVYPSSAVAGLLTEQYDSNAVSWLERQTAVWAGLLDALETDATLAERLMAVDASATTLNRVAAAAPQVSVVPVTPVAVAGEEDGFQLDQAEVAQFVTSRLDHLSLADAVRPRVEVLNGNGEILATRSVVEALVAAGFHVVSTDNADNFDFEETVVIAQGRENREAAQDAAGTLGVRSVELEVTAPSGIVDVSIIVGQDIANLRS